jgi:hypothetical protein
VSIKNKNIYFVYGNHGDSLIQLADYFYFLKDFFKYCLEKPLLVSELPIPGHINILIEYFDEKFVADILKAKEADPETRLFCIATEFKTGNTFNAFFGEERTLTRATFTMINLFKRRNIYSIAKKLPFYKTLRKFYRKMVPDSIRRVGSAHYTINFKYWKERYDYFVKALPNFDMIWLVNPQQNEAYLSIVESKRIWNLPIIPYIDTVRAEVSDLAFDPDVDFLFTGTLTPYRLEFLRTLQAKGFQAVCGFFPNFLTDSYLSQAKICLHIKPHECWPFSSNMRLHRLLMAGKYVISESFDHKDNEMIQRNFIAEVPSDKLIDFAAEKVLDKEIVTAGIKAREQYIKATEANRQEVRSEIKKMFGFECVNS